MTARLVPLLLVLLLSPLACSDGDDGGITDPGPPPSDQGLDADVPPWTGGTWYRPAAGITWQWQLSGDIRTHHPADLYDVDLFDTPTEVVQGLRSSGRRVICYLSAGSAEDWRPDHSRFPAAAVGRPLDGWPGERWLDIRRRDVFDVITARLDLARARGCDGVEPDNVQGYLNDTGFALTARDQLAFNRNLANAAHARGLSIALKNSGDQAGELEPWFDFVVNEECHAYEECGQFAPFLGVGKPVLNAEYASDLAEARRLAVTVCPASRTAGLRTLILPLDLDDRFRVDCF